jgi:hypothetical protein
MIATIGLGSSDGRRSAPRIRPTVTLISRVAHSVMARYQRRCAVAVSSRSNQTIPDQDHADSRTTSIGWTTSGLWPAAGDEGDKIMSSSVATMVRAATWCCRSTDVTGGSTWSHK